MCCWRTDVAASLSLPLCSRRRPASPKTPVQRSGQQLRWAGGGRRRAAPGPPAPQPHPCPRQTPGGKAVTARSPSDCLAQGSRRPRAGVAGDQDARGTGSASPEGRLLQRLDPRTVVVLGAPPTGPGVPGPGLRWERMRGAGL